MNRILKRRNSKKPKLKLGPSLAKVPSVVNFIKIIAN